MWSEIFIFIQRLFAFESKFDLSMIFFLRMMVRNFIVRHPHIEIFELPIDQAPLVEDGITLEEYIDTIVMKMNRDA